MTARGTRAAPSKLAICCAVPYVHENPRRGLTYRRFGTRSLRTPNVFTTSGLSSGSAANRLPSARTPYWIWRSFVGRQASPNDTAPTYSPVPLVRGDSWRVNVAGWFAARSASERYDHVPNRFVV